MPSGNDQMSRTDPPRSTADLMALAARRGRVAAILAVILVSVLLGIASASLIITETTASRVLSIARVDHTELVHAESQRDALEHSLEQRISADEVEHEHTAATLQSLAATLQADTARIAQLEKELKSLGRST